MDLFCGDALCKSRLPAITRAQRFPLPCPACKADLYPADELERVAARDRDRKRAAIMTMRSGERVAVKMKDLPAGPSLDAASDEPNLDRLLGMVDVDGKDAERAKTRRTIVMVTVLALLIAAVVLAILRSKS